ncbi:MAG: hypothetical protein WCY07_12885 [Pigmentiphaga sp.]
MPLFSVTVGLAGHGDLGQYRHLLRQRRPHGRDGPCSKQMAQMKRKRREPQAKTQSIHKFTFICNLIAFTSVLQIISKKSRLDKRILAIPLRPS